MAAIKSRCTRLAGPPGRRYVFHIHLPTHSIKTRAESSLPPSRRSRRTCRWILSKFRRPFSVGPESLSLRGTIKTRPRNKCVFPHCENGPGWPPPCFLPTTPRIRRDLPVSSALSSPPVLLFAIRANPPLTRARGRNKRADAIKSSTREHPTLYAKL